MEKSRFPGYLSYKSRCWAVETDCRWACWLWPASPDSDAYFLQISIDYFVFCLKSFLFPSLHGWIILIMVCKVFRDRHHPFLYLLCSMYHNAYLSDTFTHWFAFIVLWPEHSCKKGPTFNYFSFQQRLINWSKSSGSIEILSGKMKKLLMVNDTCSDNSSINQVYTEWNNLFPLISQKTVYRSALMVPSQNPAPLGTVYKSDSFGFTGLSMFWL